VIVVAHQTVGKELDCPPVVDFPHGLKKGFVVLFLTKDFLPSPSPVRDVIDGSRALNLQRPRHDHRPYDRKPLTFNKVFGPFAPFNASWATT
jgi:hypothetical protein